MHGKRSPMRDWTPGPRGGAMNTLTEISALNLNHLFYFHVVAEKGSVAAAARALDVAPSTIGEQLRELEATLGQPLFERNRRELRPNEAARRLLEQTANMVASARRVVHQFRPGRPAEVPVIRVACSTGLARAQVARDLLPLLDLDTARVRLESVDASRLLDAVVRGEYDLSISDEPPPDSAKAQVAVETLPGSCLVVVAADWLCQEVGSPEEVLSTVPIFHYPVSFGLRWHVERWLRHKGLEPQVLAEADDVSLVLAATRQAKCFALVPEAAVLDCGEGLRVLERCEGTEQASERYALYRGGAVTDLVRHALQLLREAPAHPQG